MKTQPKNQNKQKIAYEFMRNKILRGEYVSGYRIVISQVAKELEVSTIPIREALRQLESDGLIEIIPYSGAVVKTINETKYLEILSLLAVMGGYATALSAKMITDEQIIELESLHYGMIEAVSELDFVNFLLLNRKFHVEIINRCGNQTLIENIMQLWEKMDSVRKTMLSFIPTNANLSIQEHQHIIKLLREKAPHQEIENFAREHQLNIVRSFQKYLNTRGTNSQ